MTVVTAGIGLVVEHVREEGAPLAGGVGRLVDWELGWSRLFYVLLAVDLVGGQAAALFGAKPGAVVTVGHGLLLALLATVWAQPVLPFVAAGLGVVGLFQGMAWAGAELTGYPVGLALLALGYGLAGLRTALCPGRGRTYPRLAQAAGMVGAGAVGGGAAAGGRRRRAGRGRACWSARCWAGR